MRPLPKVCAYIASDNGYIARVFARKMRSRGSRGFCQPRDPGVQTMKDVPYNKWRVYDPEEVWTQLPGTGRTSSGMQPHTSKEIHPRAEDAPDRVTPSEWEL
jgi:hypothetical protein